MGAIYMPGYEIDTEKESKNKIYFDTETSGLKPGQIGQLAAIVEDDITLIPYNYYFEINSIEDGAAEITGRDLEWYRKASNGQKFENKASEIASIFSNKTFVAHNLKFDEQFLSIELFRCKQEIRVGGRFDTMEYFRDKMKLPGRNGGYKNPRLSELIDWLNIDKDEIADFASDLFNMHSDVFHDAVYDTTAMYIAMKVWEDMQKGTKLFYSRFVNI